MRTLRFNDIIKGTSYVDMINKAVGTNYQRWIKSSVDMQDFGVENVCAWFVFMNGEIHG